MNKIKAFNPGPSELPYDSEGRTMDAHAWGRVDESDPVTAALLTSGRLRRAQVFTRAKSRKTTTVNGEK